MVWGHDGATQWNKLRLDWSPQTSDARCESLVGALETTSDVLGRTRERRVRATPQLRQRPALDENLRRWSYSALTLPAHDAVHADARGAAAYDAGAWAEAREDVEIDSTDLLFDGLAGTALGNAVHQVFESCVGRVASDDQNSLESLVASAWRQHGLGTASASVTETFHTVLRRRLGDLFDDQCLDDFVGTSRVATEMRFTLPLGGAKIARLSELCEMVATRDPTGPYVEFFRSMAHDASNSRQLFEGFLTGSIDLVCEVGADVHPRFVIVDYKSNRLSRTSTFEPEDLISEMSHSGYPLQGLLYEVALHRYLRGRLSSYQPEVHLGGLCYLYVRGLAQARSTMSGISNWRIPPDVVVAASEILGSSSE